MKDIDLIPKGLLVSQVRNRLEKKFGKLPQKGVIAGQAVASAIYEMMGLTSNAPYNDLDVFCGPIDYPNFDGIDLRMSRMGGMAKSGKPKKSVVGMVGSFGGSPVPMESGNKFYSVAGTTYDPSNTSHNYIKIDFDYNVATHDEISSHISTIISGFDINCCQIGFDLEAGVIEWTNEFKNFLYQKELKTVFFGTPMHSAVRILKKNDDIDFAVLNVDEEMRKLQTVRAVISHYENFKESGRQFFPGNMMSNIYLRRVNERSDVLEKYFDVNSKICKFSNPDANFKSELVEREMFFLEAKTCCQSTFEFYTSAIRIDNFFQLDHFIPYFERSYELHNSPGKKNKQVVDAVARINTMTGEFFAKNVLVRNAMHEKGFNIAGFKDEYIQRYIKMMSKHPLLFSFVQDKSTSEAMKIAENLRWCEKNRMNYVLGDIENIYHRYKDNAFAEGKDEVDGVFTFSGVMNEGFKDLAKQRHDARLLVMKENFIEPRFESFCKNNSNERTKIKEITSHLDIFNEGEDMHHCVGGYWGSVEKAQCFIFHVDHEVENETESSTVEISYSDYLNRYKDYESGVNYGFHVRQNYGKGNKPVSEALKGVVDDLVKSLNSELVSTVESMRSDGRLDISKFKKEDFEHFTFMEKAAFVMGDSRCLSGEQKIEDFLEDKRINMHQIGF